MQEGIKEEISVKRRRHSRYPVFRVLDGLSFWEVLGTPLCLPCEGRGEERVFLEV
jgi:hypothetical protein